MEKIIEELTLIESSARSVIEGALAQRDQLKEKIADKTGDIVKAQEARADSEIRLARDRAARETAEALAGISVTSQKWFSSLEKQYEQNHGRWEAEIYDSIIEINKVTN